MAGSIVLSCLIWIAMISLISMAVAVWVKWRIAATALMLGIFFLLPAVAAILNAILRTQWGNVLNITHMITLVWMRLFRESQGSSWHRPVSMLCRSGLHGLHCLQPVLPVSGCLIANCVRGRWNAHDHREQQHHF